MLELENLRFGYPGQNKDWHFEFTLHQGQCLAVHGPSGSGKSTLLGLIAGFLTPKAGRILWQGEAVNHQPPWQRPVSSVFQEHNLFEHLDVFTNIGLGLHPGLKLDAVDKKAIEHTLERTGLGGFGHRMPGELSGGQRQRVAVIRAILRRQPVLLLDEPMTGLDPRARHELQAMLLEEKANGITMILASHDQDDRKALADSYWSL